MFDFCKNLVNEKKLKINAKFIDACTIFCDRLFYRYKCEQYKPES